MKQPRRFRIDALHIFVLSGFAFAQPLFDLLSRNVTFFVARQAEPAEVIFLTFTLSVFLPATLVMVQILASIFARKARNVIHYLIIVCLLLVFISLQAEPEHVIYLIFILCILLPGILFSVHAVASFFNQNSRSFFHYFFIISLTATAVLPLLKKLQEVPGAALLAAAVVSGIVFTISYVRFKAVQLFLTVLSPALLIFPILFLFNASMHKIVSPEKEFAPTPVSVRVENPLPIVMVVFDGFNSVSLMNEERSIDPARYPNFSKLAAVSTWYRNATTVSDSTGTAVPAILTGKYPDPTLLPICADHPGNIFTLLANSHNLNVIEPITQLCPERLCEREYIFILKRINDLFSDLSLVFLHIILPEDFTRRLPMITQSWKDFAGDSLTSRGREEKSAWFDRALAAKSADRHAEFDNFLHTIDSSQKPSFHFLHIMLPHTPHKYLPSGKEYNAVNFSGALKGDYEEWSSDEWAVIPYYQRYLLQVGFVDHLLGRLLDSLRKKKVFDPSLVIVTADHGASYRPGDLRRPLSETNYHDIMSVPLFIKLPYQREGRISDRNIESIDIVPTIAEILKITIPWTLDGTSAFDMISPEKTGKVIYYDQARKKKTVNIELLEKARDSTLHRKLSLFGSGWKTDGLFTVGPNSELIGKPVEVLHVEGSMRVEVQLPHFHLFQNVDHESSFVPVHITGSILPKQDTPLNLAVSLNGTIAAVSRTFQNGEEGSTMFSALIPETLLKKGNNSVEVFVVSGSTGQLLLARTKS